MSKLSYEDKINIYQERKDGNAISNISKKNIMLEKCN